MFQYICYFLWALFIIVGLNLFRLDNYKNPKFMCILTILLVLAIVVSKSSDFGASLCNSHLLTNEFSCQDKTSIYHTLLGKW